MREQDKINRQVKFLYAQAFDSQDTSGVNNTWHYNRAPDGYRFKLVKMHVHTSKQNALNIGIVALFDGHEYTHWNIWPGVESNELLVSTELSNYVIASTDYLENWECKEYTVGIRSASANAFKLCIVIWYYLEKMSLTDKLYYAVIQPKGGRFRKALGLKRELTEE